MAVAILTKFSALVEVEVETHPELTHRFLKEPLALTKPHRLFPVQALPEDGTGPCWLWINETPFLREARSLIDYCPHTLRLIEHTDNEYDPYSRIRIWGPVSWWPPVNWRKYGDYSLEPLDYFSAVKVPQAVCPTPAFFQYMVARLSARVEGAEDWEQLLLLGYNKNQEPEALAYVYTPDNVKLDRLGTITLCSRRQP